MESLTSLAGYERQDANGEDNAFTVWMCTTLVCARVERKKFIFRLLAAATLLLELKLCSFVFFLCTPSRQVGEK